MAKRANGEGSVYRRKDGRWVAAYTFEDGSVARRRAVYGRTRQDVMGQLREALRARDSGLPVNRAQETLAEYLPAWLEGSVPSLRQTSVRRYRQVINDHLIPSLGRLRLQDLRPAHLQALYAEKIASGLAPATVRLTHSVLHRALEQAVRWGRLPRNVADLVDLPRLPHKEAARLSAPQVRATMAAAADEPLRALFVLAMFVGPRRGELLALRWEDVDWERAAVRITATMQPTASGPVRAEPKSASSRRTIPLGDVSLQALRQHRANQVAQQLVAGDLWRETGLVFTTSVGGAIAPGTVIRAWHRVLARAELPPMPFHATRHTAASLMVDAGVSPRVAQERLGHATVAMTLDRYSHPGDAVRRAAATAIDAIVQTGT